MTGSQVSESTSPGSQAGNNNILKRFWDNLRFRRSRIRLAEEPLFTPPLDAPSKKSRASRLSRSWFQRTFGRFFGAPPPPVKHYSSYRILHNDPGLTPPLHDRSRKKSRVNWWLLWVRASKKKQKRSSDKHSGFKIDVASLQASSPDTKNKHPRFLKRLFLPVRRKKRSSRSLIDPAFSITSPESQPHSRKARFSIKRLFYPSTRRKKSRNTLLDKGFTPDSAATEIRKSTSKRAISLSAFFPARRSKKRFSHSLINPDSIITPQEQKPHRKKTRNNIFKRIVFPAVKPKRVKTTLLDPGFTPVSHAPDKISRSKRITFVKLFRFKTNKKRNKHQGLLSESFVVSNKPEVVNQESIRFKKGVRLSLNSLSIYILALLAMYLLHQLLTLFVAFRFDIPGDLFYNGIRWGISPDSQQWQPLSRVMLISSIAPVVSLIIAVAVTLSVNKLTKNPFKRMFLVWIAIHGYTLFFGAFAAGMLTSQGFGYLLQWLDVSYVFLAGLALASLICFVITGYKLSSVILEAAPTPPFSSKRRSILFYLMVLPAAVGIVIMVVLRLPDFPVHDNLMLVTVLAGAVPVMFGNSSKIKHTPDYSPDYGWKLKRGIFIMALVALFVYRFALSFGFNFELFRFELPVSVF